MHKNTKEYIKKHFKIDKRIIDLCIDCEGEVSSQFNKIEEVREYNQYKVLESMKRNRLSEIHFNPTTGYGYGDMGRDTLERIYADVFGCEDALVRWNITSGTHALSLCLFGILRPNDELLSITNAPYDTLHSIIGIEGELPGNLKEYNITYSQCNLTEEGKIDYDAIKNKIKDNTKLVFIQRSTGYDWRNSFSIEDIDNIVSYVKSLKTDVYCMVDNCYGEFIDFKEPTEVGADIIAGSLIKNPGGSIAPTGGYIAGKENLVDMISGKLIAPGMGRECGATLGINRYLFQGLFMAPHVVAEALKGAVLCAKIFSKLGFEVNPNYDSHRSDIIQSIKFNDSKSLVNFCQGIQSGSPVDSFITPEPGDMPNYSDKVIMAAGGFIQGSTMELSADGPIRPPYIAYMQGGVTYDHVKAGLLFALQKLLDEGCISL